MCSSDIKQQQPGSQFPCGHADQSTNQSVFTTVGLEQSDAGVVVVLQHDGGSLHLLPEDPDRLPVNHTAEIMADLERVLDAHQMAVVPDASRPPLLLLAAIPQQITSQGFKTSL